MESVNRYGSGGRSLARRAMGWTAVVLSLAIAGLWAFWGTIENFHEGWYSPNVWQNLKLSLVQYLIWPLIFAGLASVGVLRPRLGAALFVAVGLALEMFLFHFRNAASLMLILGPCLVLALLFFWGRIAPAKPAVILLLAGPGVLMLGIGAPLLWKVTHRRTEFSDAPLAWPAQHPSLIWAPPGPGWPQKGGMTAGEAEWTCDHLDETGRQVLPSPVHLWHLPAVQEAIAALAVHGSLAGCRYAGPNRFEPCDVTPDKEGPLWNVYSPVIYWWTSSYDPQGGDLRVSYNGYVLPTGGRADYTAFRAVRDVGGFASSRPSADHPSSMTRPKTRGDA